MHARTTQDVGSLVREHRLARGMSQAQLAVATSTSRQWVVDLERGKPTLALGLVLRALTAVGLTLRVEADSMPTADLGVGSIDLDAVLARAHTPIASAGTGAPATTSRTTARRTVTSSTPAARPSAARRGKRA